MKNAVKTKKEKKNDTKKRDEKRPELSVDEFQTQLAAEKEKILRLSAELDNFKKRTAKEMEEFRKFANESLFKQLLTVMDNLERAISAGSEDANAAPMLEGVQLTHKEMLKFFNSFNVKSVEAEGKPFDPSFHQAVTQQESDEHPENTVVKELQKGYMLHDRLIRPSMVMVSKAITKKEKEKE